MLQECLESEGIELLGYIAPESGGSLADVRWLGDDEALVKLDRSATVLVNGIGSANSPRLRKEVYEAARREGFDFRNVIDANANVKGSARLGNGVQILSGALIGTSVILEDNVIINTGAIIDHDSIVGAHSHISPGAVLAGEARVGDVTHVGLGARVIQGVTIGSNCTIGAGAVVVRDVPESSVAVGVPAVNRPTK